MRCIVKRCRFDGDSGVAESSRRDGSGGASRVEPRCELATTA
jgi:hypothetical protein